MNIDKLFNKEMTLTTKDGKTYHINKQQLFIHGSSSYSGEAKFMLKDNTLYVLKEVYTYENNRLRYSYVKYDNVKAFNTFEKKSDGTEIPILVIEKYDNMNTYIGSIGNITSINTDKLNKTNNESKEKLLILKLLRRNKKEKEELDTLLTA